MTVDAIAGACTEAFALAERAPEATFYHARAWTDALVRAWPRMRPGALVARDGDRVVGAMPYVDVPAGPFVRRWSMPLGTYGGPLTHPDLDENERRRVRSALERTFFESRAGRLVDAGWVDFHGHGSMPATREVPATTHVVPLEGGFDAVFERRFASDRRKRTRRARRLGVTVRRAESARDLDAFYRVYVERVRAFGTSRPHPRVLFEALLAAPDDCVRLHVAEYEGRIVGGHVTLRFRDTVTAWYGMVDETGQRTQAGTLLYAECIREACEEGYRFYNLGASAGRASLEQYKESLGGRRREYRVRVRRAAWLQAVSSAVRALRRARAAARAGRRT